MSDFGQFALNTLSNTANGAAIGSAGGPIGAGIGAGVGFGLSPLLDMLQKSEERKRRRKLEREYTRRAVEESRDKYQQQLMALGGVDPRISMALDNPYDTEKVKRDAAAYAEGQIPLPQPNYNQAIQSLGSLGNTIGMQARTADLADRTNQFRELGRIGQTGNPWASFADQQQGDDIEQMLAQARDAAWQRTGGW